MKIKDLIKELEKYNEQEEVVIWVADAMEGGNVEHQITSVVFSKRANKIMLFDRNQVV